MTPGARYESYLLRATSREEKEIWPEFFWSLAALLKAGYLPAQALETLLKSQPSTTAPQTLLQTLKEGASYLAHRDLKDFLEKAHRLGAHGYPLSPALDGLEPRRTHSRQRLAELGAVLAVAERTGAPLASLIEDLASYCEKDIDASLARESAMGAPTTTAKILSWLPLLGLALGILMGTDPLGVLFGSLPGAFLALLGAALALAGRRWTKRLVKQAETEQVTAT